MIYFPKKYLLSFSTYITLAIVLISCASQDKNKFKGTGSNKRMETYKLASDDGFFETYTLAYGQPTVESLPGSYYMSIPMTNEHNMECYLYQQRFDSAQGMIKFNHKLRQLSEKKGYLTPMAVGSHVDVFKKAAAFSTDFILFEKKNPNKFINSKNISVSFDTETLMCTVHFPKHQETFAEVVKVILENMKIKQRSIPVQSFDLERIYEFSAHGNKFGWTHFYEDQEKIDSSKGHPPLKKYVSLTATMARGNPVSFVGHDWITSEWAEPNGELVDGLYIYLRNDQVIFNLKLKQIEIGIYEVKGSYYGKNVEYRIDAKGLKHHAFVQTTLNKNRIKLKGSSEPIKFSQFIPHLAPNRAFSGEINFLNENKKDGLVFQGKVNDVSSHYFYKDWQTPREYLILSKINGTTILQRPVIHREKK